MATGLSGTLYVGVASVHLAMGGTTTRGQGIGTLKSHGPIRLVYVESHDSIQEAIAREKQKALRRGWKLNLIERSNLMWDDLFPTLCLF